MVNALRILIFRCIFLGAALQVTGQGIDGELEDGLAIVTTCKGAVIFKPSRGKSKKAEHHAVETLTGVEVSSGDNDYIFLSLSNGTGLGIYKNSKVNFESYLQQPFAPAKESLEYEATRSRLVVRLDQGSISFSADKISPLSEFIIKLPYGHVKVQGASGRVSNDRSGAIVSITSGIVSYHQPGTSKNEEFINSPNVVRVSDQGAPLKGIGKLTPSESDRTRHLTRRLVDATHRARKRVVFRPQSEEASIPRPVLVARPEDLLKPSPRPHTYLD